LLFSDLYEALRDVATERTGVTRRHVAVVAVLGNLYAQLLSRFVLDLLQRRSGLRNDQRVAVPVLACILCVFGFFLWGGVSVWGGQRFFLGMFFFGFGGGLWAAGAGGFWFA